MAVINKSAVSLLKKTFGKSKQSIMGKSLFGNKFGSHGKDLQIGKKFKSSGTSTKSIKSFGELKSGGISPSTEEFTNLLNKNAGGGGGGKKGKKSFFGKKFG